MANDNYVDNRGHGTWLVTTYNPEGHKPFGPYTGTLLVSQNFHIIYGTYDPGSERGIECVASFPNPNVAAIENQMVVAKQQNK